MIEKILSLALGSRPIIESGVQITIMDLSRNTAGTMLPIVHTSDTVTIEYSVVKNARNIKKAS